MDIITIRVASIDQVDRQALAAVAGDKSQQGSFYTFQTQERMREVLTPNRLKLLEMMVGAGPMSIREAASRLERDVSAVHADVQTLLNCGVLDKAGDRIVFPYDAMRIEATVVPAG